MPILPSATRFIMHGALHYMSSEDSEVETTTTNGPKPRKIKKLLWERSKLRNIKAKLDEDHLKGLSERQ